MREPYTTEELKDIALDLFHGSKFISWGLKDDDVRMVFMPFLFMEEKDVEELIKQKPVAFFADTKDAFNLSINGLPSFWSMSYLTEQENKFVGESLEKLRDAERKAHNTAWENLQEAGSMIVKAIKAKLDWAVKNLLPQ